LGTEANRVDRRVVPEMRDGVVLIPDVDAARGDEAPVTELLEEHEEPPLARECNIGRSRGEPGRRLAEARPGAEHNVPRSRHSLPEAGATFEVVRLRLEAGELAVTLGNAL